MAEEPTMESVLQTIKDIYARRASIDIVSVAGHTGATTVCFVCSKCSLLYKTTQVRRSKAKSGKKDCEECGAPVHRWSGQYDFIDWHQVKPEQPE
jgi:hypothetical protein